MIINRNSLLAFNTLILAYTLFIQSAFAADPILIPPSPQVAASSFVLLDFDSGKILAEKNADAKLAPASLTKVMTAYVVFRELNNGHLTLDEAVIISEKAWKTPGSRMFIEVNKQVSIEDLLKGMIIQSGNDASVALAEHVGGDEATFAQLMNQHAERLGMVNTHFINSMGLPSEDHYTSAKDLALLTRAMIEEFPEYYSWHAIKEFTYNNITQKNRNKLLWRDDTVDGVKTGHTEKAGYCLVASAKRNDMRLISVVMGTQSENARANANQSLLNYGFRFFETHLLYKSHEVLTTTRVWKGEAENLDLGLAQNLYVTIPRRQYDALEAVMNVDTQITAPVAEGESFGNVNVTIGGEEVANKPLIALSSIDKGSFFQRIYDEALLLME